MIGRDKVGQLGLGYLFATGYVATVIRIYLSYLQMAQPYENYRNIII